MWVAASTHAVISPEDPGRRRVPAHRHEGRVRPLPQPLTIIDTPGLVLKVGMHVSFELLVSQFERSGFLPF